MTSAPDSPLSLFAAAQDVARQQGLLGGRLASLEHSEPRGKSYLLQDANSASIARLPLEEVRTMAATRHKLLMESAGVKQVAEIHPVRRIDRRVAFRILPDDQRALAWALSEGRRVPMGRAFNRRDLLIGIALLPLCLVPGVVYLVAARRRHRRFRQDTEALMQRWRLAGRPDPSSEWFDSL
jgi:hypothetical protein